MRCPSLSTRRSLPCVAICTPRCFSPPPSLPQATAWIKSDGIVVDNPELVITRKVCRATYYEPTQQATLLTMSVLTKCRSTYYEHTHQVLLYLL